MQKIAKFYETVSVEERGGEWRLLLDGREAKTRGRAPLGAPTSALAEAIGEEWRVEGKDLIVDDMPLTKLAWTAIDLGEAECHQWTEQVLGYLGADLLCYRAAAPALLAERQARVWGPFLRWAEDRFGAALTVTSGVGAVSQPEAACAAVRGHIEGLSPWRLIALKSATEIAGSAVLGLALEARAFSAEALFEASRLDEHFQSERWGVDAEAAAREAALRRDFFAADCWLGLLEP